LELILLELNSLELRELIKRIHRWAGSEALASL
jgi:hypothetical protein